jgi:hypothetical protein
MTPLLGFLVSVALVAGATGCGGGDDDATGTGDAATTTLAPGDVGATTLPGDDGSNNDGSSEDGGDASATTTPGDSSGSGGGGLDASVAAPDMTSEQICAAMTANQVGTALGVRGVTASPGNTTGTPQCSYHYTLDSGEATDATIAVLRSQADMGGRFGDDAFQFVVDLNKAAAQTPVTETPLEVGSQAVLLTGSTLYMAIVQLGGRIVTVLVNTDAADAGSVTGLAGQTIVLAP